MRSPYHKAMEQGAISQDRNGGSSPNRLAVLTILLCWVTQFILLTTQMTMAESAAGLPILRGAELVARGSVSLMGIIISLGMLIILSRLRDMALGWRVAIAAASAVGAALLHAFANFVMFSLFGPQDAMRRATLSSYTAATTVWFWTYGTVAALLLAIYYYADLRERDRRLAQLRSVAQSAQIRALRYQINPHFMFNTLNSIASLVGRNEGEAAESMVENLSDFLHTTLELNPEDDIPLSRELELQQLYLSIEAARFPDRLVTEVDVPDALHRLLVPSLITQPLIENVIKHAVRKSTSPISLRIVAREADGKLELVIRNSLGDAAELLRGPPGIGLANVNERLTMRYPHQSRCTTTSDENGFCVRLVMPAIAMEAAR